MKQLFKDKKILITGHNGFKGSWLSAWLHLLGADIFGISLENQTSEPSHFDVAKFSNFVEEQHIDIRNSSELSMFVQKIEPDFVFHLAAQALVKKSYSDPIATYETNTIGTLNLLESLKMLKKKCTAVLITSDKCYENVEWIWGYRETDSLGGPDPYSASKGAAELIIRSHVKSYFPKKGNVRIAIGRAGNVIGGGDWALDRIVPDCVRSWTSNKAVKLRNSYSTRPWQHVLEPLSGYLTLAAELYKKSELHGEPFNFGPSPHHNYTVLELVQEMSKHWNKVLWEDFSDPNVQPYESGLLKLNCDKALHDLNWRAILSFQETVVLTSEWYRSYYDDSSTIEKITFSQINKYQELARNKGLRWVL